MKACVVLLFLVGLCVAAENDAVPAPVAVRGQRIVGGTDTAIQNYPYMVALLTNWWGILNYYTQACGGTILTQRTVLTAAHCLETDLVWHEPQWWQVRVGSTFASSGGSVHAVNTFIAHQEYVGHALDVAVIQVATSFVFAPGFVQPAKFATGVYTLPDNEVVVAIGWGTAETNGLPMETLQEVELQVINQEVCTQRWGALLQADMICTGWLDVGGRDQCQGDSGGPLLHGDVVVGICSWGGACADAYYPGVNARVSYLWSWIVTALAQLK